VISTFSGHRPDGKKRFRPRKEILVESPDLGEESVFVFSPFGINEKEKEVIGLVTNGRFIPAFRHQSIESSAVNIGRLLHLIYTYPLGKVFLRVEEGYLLRLIGELSSALDEEGWEIHLLAWRGNIIAGVYTYYGAIGELVHTWWNPETGEAYPRPVQLVTHRPLA
jgi:hypothetical protein